MRIKIKQKIESVSLDECDHVSVSKEEVSKLVSSTANSLHEIFMASEGRELPEVCKHIKDFCRNNELSLKTVTTADTHATFFFRVETPMPNMKSISPSVEIAAKLCQFLGKLECNQNMKILEVEVISKSDNQEFTITRSEYVRTDFQLSSSRTGEIRLASDWTLCKGNGLCVSNCGYCL